jgi:hypothetical protein
MFADRSRAGRPMAARSQPPLEGPIQPALFRLAAPNAASFCTCAALTCTAVLRVRRPVTAR